MQALVAVAAAAAARLVHTQSQLPVSASQSTP